MENWATTNKLEDMYPLPKPKWIKDYKTFCESSINIEEETEALRREQLRQRHIAQVQAQAWIDFQRLINQ